MATDPSQDRLIWIDLEMTGLDTEHDGILEIATVVTDGQLNVLAEGPELAIAHPLATLEAMDDWNRNQHGKSGLWRRVLEEGVPLADAEARTLAFLREWVPARRGRLSWWVGGGRPGAPLRTRRSRHGNGRRAALARGFC